MSLNVKAAGKTYSPCAPFEITDHDSMYYALAYNEDNDFYFDKRKNEFAVSPPMFAVRYMGESVVDVLNDLEVGLNFGAMLHYAQEFEWLNPVKAGDRIVSRAKIGSIEPGKSGGILRCEVESRNQDDEAVAKAVWSFLDRSAASPDGQNPDRPKRITGEPLYTQEMKVKKGQTWIYAEASGDTNPIHLSDQAAQEAGLDGIILQGLCTMAFAHKVCVDNLAGQERDPGRVRKLAVKFARPVEPGETIIFRLHESGREDNGLRFDIAALNSKGKNVLQDAWCLVV
ncbi:MAG: MaoC family dehydratase N-terminal domain-containing protein [Spirochaetes bacterium]|nr:MaoC family dehydratase N-terminal domain-containing protein [Spirochaetota bacterium]